MQTSLPSFGQVSSSTPLDGCVGLIGPQLMADVCREPSPPQTPSRRHASMESSPVSGGPHFVDGAWQNQKRRRTGSIADIHHRSSSVMSSRAADQPHSMPLDPQLASNYSSPRTSHAPSFPPPAPSHHHRPSLPYSTASAPATGSHSRHQSTPVPHAHSAVYLHPPHASMSAPAPHPTPSSGPSYERRTSYYPEHPQSVHGHPYDSRPHDAYYTQPAYLSQPPSGYESAYPHQPTQSYNYTFQSALGMDQNSFNRKRRGNLPKEATTILKDWFSRHRDSPYPSEEEKVILCKQTRLSMNQVRQIPILRPVFM